MLYREFSGEDSNASAISRVEKFGFKMKNFVDGKKYKSFKIIFRNCRFNFLPGLLSHLRRMDDVIPEFPDSESTRCCTCLISPADKK